QERADDLQRGDPQMREPRDVGGRQRAQDGERARQDVLTDAEGAHRELPQGEDGEEHDQRGRVGGERAPERGALHGGHDSSGPYATLRRMRWLIVLPFDRPGHMGVDFAEELVALGHEVRTFAYRRDNALYKN